MQFTYLLIYLSYFIFITADELVEDYDTPHIWEVNLQTDVNGNEIASLERKSFDNDLFNNQSTVFIVFHRIYGIRRRNCAVYYWFGENVSLNQRIKTVELVSKLRTQLKRNKHAVFLTRCVSGTEPKNFQNFTGRQYKSETRLYRVKGDEVAYIIPVVPRYDSLTFDDSFVLTHDNFVYIFVARKSNKAEKLKALKFGNYINNVEHDNQNSLVYVDCSSSPDIGKVNTIFEILGYDITSECSLPAELCFSLEEDTSQEESLESDIKFQQERQKETVKVYVIKIQDGNMVLTSFRVTSEWFVLQEIYHTAIIMDPVYGFHVFAHIGPKAETAETEFILKKLEQLNLQNAGVHVVSYIDYPPADFVILFRDLERYYHLE